MTPFPATLCILVTFDVLGSLFDLSPSKAEEQVQKLLPVLKQAEKKLQVLPDRHFKPASKDDQPIENSQKIMYSQIPHTSLELR